MIEWRDDCVLCSIPPKIRIDFKCACGNSEVSRYQTLESISPSFKKEWEKANGE